MTLAAVRVAQLMLGGGPSCVTFASFHRVAIHEARPSPAAGWPAAGRPAVGDFYGASYRG